MTVRIGNQEQRSRVGAGMDPAAEVAERVRAHVNDPLERLRALLADARAGELEPHRTQTVLDAAQELVDRIDDVDGSLEGFGTGGPGPRLTLALASELSFIARHLESPLPAPTVERLQPRVRRAARLATLWLSPHEWSATTTHGPSSAASAAWRATEVANDARPAEASPSPISPPAPIASRPAEQAVSPGAAAMAAMNGAAHEVVQARLAELRADRNALGERLEILDRYWRFATHELRNAAHSLVMVVEHLESATLANAPWLEPLGRASRAVVGRSQEALDDRAIARGMFTVECETVDLVEVALSALEEAGAMAERRGIRLVGERLPVGQPLWAHADPQRVQQILHNLLRNAFEVTPPGGFVMMEANVIDDQACLVVSDSGPGLDPVRAQELLHLGDRQSGTGERAGLGLPICRHLAEAMGGSIRPCEPQPGMGARFLIALPRAGA